MATITRFVRDGLDDAYTFGGTAINTSGFISAGDASGTRSAGMIFRDIPIPRTSTINGATVTFIANASLSGTNCNTRFYGEASSNPNPYTTVTDFENRSLGSITTDWTTIPAWTAGSAYTSPDIKEVVQEIVNRGDWASGKGMGIYWKNNASDTNARRAAYGFEDSSGSCASITIDYTPAPVMTMRVSLPGYDALTDATVDHYSLYADEDNVLIKEYARGTINIGNYKSGTVSHNLGYIPYSMVFAKNGSNFYHVSGAELSSGFQAYYTSSTANLIITNDNSSTLTYYYFVFYDNATTL